MTTETTFKTVKGTEIRLFIQTETPNLADHNVMNPCWDLMVALGDRFPVVASVIEHPEHGLCVCNGTLGTAPFLAPVPPAACAAVKAVAEAYTTKRDRRYEEAKELDRVIEARRAPLRRVLGRHCVAD